MSPDSRDPLEELKENFPDKFGSVNEALQRIRRGSSIFIGSSCGEPQHLLRSLVKFVEESPHSIYGAEIIHVWTLGVAPYAEKRFELNFRHNSFFISDSSRETINSGLGDYTPISLSRVPTLFRRGVIGIDAALIQVSLPDVHGNMSLGVSVDIVKAAVEKADFVIAQVNAAMPRVHGDCFLRPEDIDCLIPHDEPLLEYFPDAPDDIARDIGNYVSRIVQDGDTIQVGYGSMPNAILGSLAGKRDLGVHTEMLSDGIVDLMRRGVVNNSAKLVDRGKTVASFCMGSRDTYAFINDNPQVEFRPIDYTNNIFTIAAQGHMTSINSALQIDLTGQATAESIGTTLYSGIGGQTDFMRGAALAPRGKGILVLRSTSNDGRVSRIVPCLDAGASCTIGRGDVQYVVTEYGIAYLHGKNLRERAMSLIAIAHPDFRSELIEKARELGLIYRDQVFIEGKRGEYPGGLESPKVTKKGLEVFLRPIKISDEDLLKRFLYSLSDKSLYTRFFADIHYIPHGTLQSYVVIDYTREMTILAVISRDGVEEIAGVGQYVIGKDTLMADAAFLVRDDFQNRGIGTLLLQYLEGIARREGLHGFSAMVLRENDAMLRLFDNAGFDMKKSMSGGVFNLTMMFRERDPS